MKKIISLLIFLIVFSINSQTFKELEERLIESVKYQNWLEGMNLYYKLFEKYPNESKSMSIDSFSLISNYQNFQNIELLITENIEMNLNSNIKITRVSFSGGAGCIAFIPLEVSILIDDSVIIESNEMSISMPKSKYLYHLGIFSNIIENCTKNHYGELLSTGDLTGNLKICYSIEDTEFEKEYSISFGYVENVFIYLGLYSIMQWDMLLLI